MNHLQFKKDYLLSKIIPISFYFNDKGYTVYIDIDEYNFQKYPKNYKWWKPKRYPNYSYPSYRISYMFSEEYVDTLEIYDRTDFTVFDYETNDSIEKCISEFLYWWEFNKDKCTNIKYFEKCPKKK